MAYKVLVLHGPNLNFLGVRERSIYGTSTLEDINDEINRLADEINISVDCFQSNFEGELVEKIQEAYGNYHGLIINPGALTHYSIALRDALLLLDVPIIEVHLSNIYKREEFRKTSVTAPAVTGQISGLGPKSYYTALSALVAIIEEGDSN